MSHKQKGTPKEKEHIVQQCLENQLSHSKAAELMNVDGSTIRRWIKKYLAEGIDAFLPYAKNRVYTAELKLNAVRDYLVGTRERVGERNREFAKSLVANGKLSDEEIAACSGLSVEDVGALRNQV